MAPGIEARTTARAFVLPGVLLLTGAFLVFMAALLPLVVAPSARRIPLDRFSVVTAEGTGSYTSPRTGELVTTTALRETLSVRGDVEAGSEQVAVWEVFAAVEDVAPGVAQADRVVADRREVVALDRRSAATVRCCGEQPPHEGLTALRFPFGTAETAWDVWDPHLLAARPASPLRRDAVGGLDVLVFLQRVEPAPVGTVGPAEPGAKPAPVLYAADRELWVEPDTGTVVRVDESLRWIVEDPGEPPRPYRSADLTWAQESVDQAVASAGAVRSRLRRLTIVLPAAALAIGTVLLVAGARATARLRG